MGKKTYFASDFHLGIDGYLPAAARERQAARWLDAIAPDADKLYLVGDLFEFWFEYRTVVPKGFVRILGRLAEMRDAGIPIEAFTGNHDLWMFGYFEQELGIPVHKRPISARIGDKDFFIGHGDGLGPGDKGYKRMKKVFIHPLSQRLFRALHPDWGVRMAHFFSSASRRATPPEEREWLGEDREWLYQYCLRKIAQGIEPHYFVFGHRHLPVDIPLPNGRSRYINLGEWMYRCSYAEFDGAELTLRYWEREQGL